MKNELPVRLDADATQIDEALAKLERLIQQQSVNVGDRMRISVELIRQIAEAPDFTTHTVRLREVRVEEDGTKTLVMDRLDD